MLFSAAQIEEARKQVITYLAYYHVQPPFETDATSDGAETYKFQCFRNDICTPKVNKVRFAST